MLYQFGFVSLFHRFLECVHLGLLPTLQHRSSDDVEMLYIDSSNSNAPSESVDTSAGPGVARCTDKPRSRPTRVEGDFICRLIHLTAKGNFIGVLNTVSPSAGAASKGACKACLPILKRNAWTVHIDMEPRPVPELALRLAHNSIRSPYGIKRASCAAKRRI